MRGLAAAVALLVVGAHFALAPAVHAIETYAAGWSVTTELGAARTDGSIQVGDELNVWVKKPAGTTVTSCGFYVATRGGEMQGRGEARSDGTCGLRLIVPQPAGRDGEPSADRARDDVCVWFARPTFGDGVPRELRSADRNTPGGVWCGVRWGDPEVLDFAFDGSGTERTFASTPQLLSWNIADWDPAYQPLRFNTTWQVAFPDWVTWCEGPFLNGSWTTTFFTRNRATDCPDWSLRLPGVLPSTLPWSGAPGAWDMEIIVDYSTASMEGARTIAIQVVPYEPSDGVFESSFAAVSPIDLATARFVTAGETWRPSYKVSGGTAVECELSYGVNNTFRVAPDSNGVCTFEVPAFELPNDGIQYGVSARFTDGAGQFIASYGGSIMAIPAPTAPTIPAPSAGEDGLAGIEAQPGGGQGMSLEMSVAAAPTSGLRVAASPSAAAKNCAAIRYASNLQFGGGLTSVKRRCSLAPGTYVITARMVDATGKVKVRRRTFSVVPADGAGVLALSPKAVSASTPGRTITLAFTMGYGGMDNGALRFRVPDGWSPPSTNPAAAGYVAATLGTVAVSGRQVTISGLSGAGGRRLTVSYGSKAGGGPGARVPAAVGAQQWIASSRGTATGSFTRLAASPSLTVHAADGSGAISPSASSVPANKAGRTITFSYTAAAGGMKAGEIRLTVPDGWSAPSLEPLARGYSTASKGQLAIANRTIVVSNVTVPGGTTMTITYGSKAAGGPGARSPSNTGNQTWLTRQRSTSAGILRKLVASPIITVE